MFPDQDVQAARGSPDTLASSPGSDLGGKPRFGGWQTAAASGGDTAGANAGAALSAAEDEALDPERPLSVVVATAARRVAKRFLVEMGRRENQELGRSGGGARTEAPTDSQVATMARVISDRIAGKGQTPQNKTAPGLDAPA